MNTVILYSVGDCEDCENILIMLSELRNVYPHQVVKIAIDDDNALYEMYKNEAPFLQIGPYRLLYPFSSQELKVTLGAAKDRFQAKVSLEGEDFKRRLNDGHNFTRSDRISLWLSSGYIWLINLIIFIYVGLPFLAPVLMKSGEVSAAKVIYTVYSPLCHQLAFRSWFFYGEQPFYPRELAGLSQVVTYEQLTQDNALDISAARKFVGNEKAGYKVALCERDVAIYASMLLFGVLYAINGRKIKSIPWYSWLIFGLTPIAIDGVSQLTMVVQNSFPGLNIYRESTPFLRSLTGGLFGLMTAWYIYPLIEEAMLENRNLLLKKQAVSQYLRIRAH